MSATSVLRLRYLLRPVDVRRGSHELPLLSVSQYRGVVLRSELTDDEPRADDLSKYKVCRAGDIVINRMSAYQGALGRSAWCGIVSPDYIVLRPLHGVDSHWLHHLMRSTWFVSEMAARIRGIGSIGTGNVRTPRVSAEEVGDIAVHVPPLQVQQRIACFLDTETARIDALVAKKRRMIDLLNEWFEAQRSSQVLRGLDPVHRNRDQGALPKSWSVASLGVLIMLHRGFDLPLDARATGAVPVVSSGGISGSHSEAICDPPGVITGRYGTIGSVFYVDEPHWPLNTTLFVSDFRGNDPRWVYHLLAALPLDFDAEKSAVTGINRNVIGSLRAPHPPSREQRELAASLDACMKCRDQIVEPLKQQIDLLHEHRQALITAAVTGELEVPGVAA